MSKEIAVIEDVLGVDLSRIYLLSMFSNQDLPEYDILYENYNIEVIQRNLDITKSQLVSYIDAAATGSFNSSEPVNEITKLSESDFMLYLIAKRLSFRYKKQCYNLPFKEVW